jgi:hypothetical protein
MRGLLCCGYDPQPAFDVAGGCNEEILQLNLCKSAIPATAQTMTAHKLANGSLDCGSLMHLFFEHQCLLFDTSGLQAIMMLAYNNRTMCLVIWNTLRF